MNLDKLKQVLVEHGIYKKTTSKNYICICPYCKDHPNPAKRGHLYVSLDVNIPVAHCFYSGCRSTVSKLVKDLTGSTTRANEIISLEEQKTLQAKNSKIRKNRERTTAYKLPVIDTDSFVAKRIYIKKRTNNKLNAEDIPNIVFDFSAFFNMNKLDLVGSDQHHTLSNEEFDIIQKGFVGFLSRHNTMLYCRSIDDACWFKFKKISLQSDVYHLLDYWCISTGNTISDTVVLSEGNFDILGEYVTDSLKLKDRVRLYASGNSFSYSSLLKSVCFDENMYKCDVIILSDTDKDPFWYRKFKRENDHVIKKLDIWGNKAGKDFGTFPVVPFLYQ